MNKVEKLKDIILNFAIENKITMEEINNCISQVGYVFHSESILVDKDKVDENTKPFFTTTKVTIRPIIGDRYSEVEYGIKRKIERQIRENFNK